MDVTKRILIVDDSPTITMLVSTALDLSGGNFYVETADDGVEALEKIKVAEQSYDLVITDYRMPKMDGIALAYQIRKISSGTRIIMMTGYSSEIVQESIEPLELDGVIDKPIQLEHIREIVNTTLARVQKYQNTNQASEAITDFPITRILHELQATIEARSILLLSNDGYLLGMVGHDDELDVSTICALVAANFQATSELARLLGGRTTFKSSYQEGPEYNIYATRVNDNTLLVDIFGIGSKRGVVTYYTNKTVEKIYPLLEELDKVPDEFHFSNDFDSTLDDDLNALFG